MTGNSYGMIDFQDDYTTLPAVLTCNGSKNTVSGVSMCQVRASLMEQVVFDVPVVVSGKCQLPVSQDKKTYMIVVQPDICVYAFMEIADPHRSHRLTTIGYLNIMLRKN
jgi:hypothetical protein